MKKLIILNNFFLFFKFFIVNNNIFLINNNFFLLIYFYKLFKLYKYFFIFKKFYLYSLNSFLNNFLINFLNKFFINIFLKILYINLGFVYYRYFVKIGLGFRKKSMFSKKIFAIYAGKRHWIFFKIKSNFCFNLRRKNVYIFTQFKQDLIYYSSVIKHIRKESLFKTKGIFFKRAIIKRKRPRSILFARRVKFFKVKLKLSKKQKLV